MYDLLAPGIQTIKNNMTRFVIIKRKLLLAEEDINRASLNLN
jgi:prephenate dehydratase